MAITTFVFNEGAKQLTSNGTVDWAAHTIKARLVDVGVTPDRDDAVMTGYTKIGTDQTLANKSKAKDTVTERIVFDADNPSFASPGSGDTVGSVVIYAFGTVDGDSIPLFCLAITPVLTDNTTLLVDFPATGMGYTQQ